MSSKVRAEQVAASIAALEEAKRDMVTAESRLTLAIGEITSAPRASKTNVSLVIEEALQKLRDARSKVDDAERTIAAAVESEE